MARALEGLAELPEGLCCLVWRGCGGLPGIRLLACADLLFLEPVIMDKSTARISKGLPLNGRVLETDAFGGCCSGEFVP